MSIIYMNGFEWNSVYEGALRNTGCTFDTTRPRSGNYCLYVNNDTLRTSEFTPVDEFYMQFHFNYAYLASGTQTFLKWYHDSTVLGTLTVDYTTQFLKIYEGNTTTLRGIGVNPLIANKWYLIEVHGIFDTTSGVFDVRVDGLDDISYSGETSTIAGATVNFMEFYSGTGLRWYLDDVILVDTNGSMNNSWLGGQRIILLHPWAKGEYTQWNQQSDVEVIDNYECVDNVPSLDATEYLWTVSDNIVDTYVMENLPTDAYSVAAVRCDAWALKNSGSLHQLDLALLPAGGTFEFSPGQDLTVSYSLESWIFETIPGTTEVFDVSTVNNLQAGFRSHIP